MAILNTEPNYELPAVKNKSEDCIDLMKQLLKKSPAERILIKDALEHPFFAQLLSEAEMKEQASPEYREQKMVKLLSTQSVSPNFLNINVEKLKDFSSSRGSNSSQNSSRNLSGA